MPDRNRQWTHTDCTPCYHLDTQFDRCGAGRQTVIELELEECREDGDGELLSLYCDGWVDKTALRDACTAWLAHWGYTPAMASQQWFIAFPGSYFDPRRPALLAAPEPEHITYLRWRLVPGCTLDGSRRCAPGCDCQLYFVRCKDRGPGKRYTVWSVEAAKRRYYEAKSEAGRGSD